MAPRRAASRRPAGEAGTGQPGVSEYEAAREKRIRQNKDRLAKLGLAAPAGPPVPARAPARPRARAEDEGDENEAPGPVTRSKRARGAAPTRRSGRLRGERPEFVELPPELDEDRPPPARRARAPPARIADPDALDALNLHRVRTMSEDALRRRVWKIRRPDKLDSFIKVGEQGGRGVGKGEGGGGAGGRENRIETAG